MKATLLCSFGLFCCLSAQEVAFMKGRGITENSGKASYRSKEEDVSPEPKEILYLNFRAGAAQPVGEFGDQSLNNLKAGLALSGYILEFSATIKLAPYLGLTAHYRHQANRFNVLALERAYETSFPGTAPDVKAEDWQNKGLLAGLSLDIPVVYIKHLFVTADVLVGVPKYYFPDLRASFLINGRTLVLTQTADAGRAPAFSPGAGLAYRIRNTVAITAGVEYITAKPSFTVYTEDNFGYSTVDNYKQHFESVNLKGGVRIILQEKKKFRPAKSS